MLRWVGDGGIIYFVFWEVVGIEGSFYSFAVSRKYLEKIEGVEKGIR